MINNYIDGKSWYSTDHDNDIFDATFISAVIILLTIQPVAETLNTCFVLRVIGIFHANWFPQR